MKYLENHLYLFLALFKFKYEWCLWKCVNEVPIYQIMKEIIEKRI
jgi:hypothetical protein